MTVAKFCFCPRLEDIGRTIPPTYRATSQLPAQSTHPLQTVSRRMLVSPSRPRRHANPATLSTGLVDTRFCIISSWTNSVSFVIRGLQGRQFLFKPRLYLLFHKPIFACLPTNGRSLVGLLERPCASEPNSVALKVSRVHAQRQSQLAKVADHSSAAITKIRW